MASLAVSCAHLDAGAFAAPSAAVPPAMSPSRPPYGLSVAHESVIAAVLARLDSRALCALSACCRLLHSMLRDPVYYTAVRLECTDDAPGMRAPSSSELAALLQRARGGVRELVLAANRCAASTTAMRTAACHPSHATSSRVRACACRASRAHAAVQVLRHTSSRGRSAWGLGLLRQPQQLRLLL